MKETWLQSLGQEDPLEKGMATHSGILAWRIPWTEELGGLQSMGSQSQTRMNHERFRFSHVRGFWRRACCWWYVPPCLSSPVADEQMFPDFNVFMYITFFFFLAFCVLFKKSLFTPEGRKAGTHIMLKNESCLACKPPLTNWVLCVMWCGVEFCCNFDVFFSVPWARRLLASAGSRRPWATSQAHCGQCWVWGLGQHLLPPSPHLFSVLCIFHNNFRVSLSSSSWTLRILIRVSWNLWITVISNLLSSELGLASVSLHL